MKIEERFIRLYFVISKEIILVADRTEIGDFFPDQGIGGIDPVDFILVVVGEVEISRSPEIILNLYIISKQIYANLTRN